MPGGRHRPARSTGRFVRVLVHLVVLAVAIGLISAVLPGFHVSGGFLTWLWLALLLSLVNAVLGGVLRFVARPLIWLTFGLASFAISVIVLAVTAGLSSSLDLDGAWPAVWAAAGIAVLTVALRYAVERVLVPLEPGPLGSRP